MTQVRTGHASVMTYDLFEVLAGRRGHFQLESGYHSDLWLDLDALFVDPVKIAPAITMLAGRLRRYGCDAVCGPMTGGAFLAQALAIVLRTCFFYAAPVRSSRNGGLFTAEYRLPEEMRRQVAGARVAVVDDAISAGSSVRATVAALESAGASIVVVGTLLELGDVAARHFAERRIPIEAVARREFTLWLPADCPLCAARVALE